MKALLFTGQGSQVVGMASSLYNEVPKVKELFERANALLGYDLTSIMFEGPDETLKETRYTQPALFLHEAAIMATVGDKLVADCVAGHSLGEFSAYYASDVLTFEDALSIIALRGSLMFEAGTKQKGGMLAVLGLENSVVESICSELAQQGKIVVPANYNSPGQIVVSGNDADVDESMELFKSAGASMVKKLVVSGAFHSPLMEFAKDALAKKINETTFSTPKCPVYPNVTAVKTTDAALLKELCVQQLTSPVRWAQTLEQMHNDSVDTFIEIGPGKVLQGLVKRTLKGVTFTGIDTFTDCTQYI
jgi:[acyl-carrier-protein] S-malonyltransferase